MKAVGHIPAHGDRGTGDAATAPRLHSPKMARQSFPVKRHSLCTHETGTETAYPLHFAGIKR